jgi:hypothetical protein
MGILVAGCADQRLTRSLVLKPAGQTCELVIAGVPEVGDMRLWAPEAIMSETGACAVYPVGSAWREDGQAVIHEVGPEGGFGPGNFERIDAHTGECVGIRMPIHSPVKWATRVEPTSDGVEFSFQVTNVGSRPIHKAAAAVCLKFFNGDWWADEHVFVRSGGQVRSLAELGRDAGPPNGFEAYLLEGESFDHVFYRQFWGFNGHRLDRPVMVSEHAANGVCVGIESKQAYFLHSNLHNPCTDIMLAFGDIEPGQTAEASGRLWIRRGKAASFLK